jgi:hypothetical protein
MQSTTQQLHDHPFVVALLGGKAEVAKVKLEAMRTSNAALAAQRRAHRIAEMALDEVTEEQTDRDAEEQAATCLCMDDGDMAGIVDAVVSGTWGG